MLSAAALVPTIQSDRATAAQPPATPAPPGTGSSQNGGYDFREPAPLNFNDHAGYVQIFDGTSLTGWDGDPKIWHLENGMLVGVLKQASNNSYITYRSLEAKDFDLKLEIKIEQGGGTGVNYRSRTGLPWTHPRPGLPEPDLKWMMTGPQADFWYPVSPRAYAWNGQFYADNTPMQIVSYRGQVVEMVPGQEKRLVATLGDRSALGGYVKPNDWNEYHIIARGGTFVHILNGQLMTVLVDDDAKDSNNQSGYVGIKIEGFPSKVSVRNVWIRKLN